MNMQKTQTSEQQASPMPRKAIISLGIYFIASSLLILYFLIMLWPSPHSAPAVGKEGPAAAEKSSPDPEPGTPSQSQQIPSAPVSSSQGAEKQGQETSKQSAQQEKDQVGRLRAWSVRLGYEERLLLIVAFAGALGAYVHAAQSFVSYVGNQQIVSSWLWWYLIRPFIGLALAEILYLAVRGGFFTLGSDPHAVNHFGIAALAGLSGMFSKEAVDKLHELFKNLFRTEKEPPRKNKLEDP